MLQLRRICVYCGSSPGADPAYAAAAAALGRTLVECGLELVYGGSVVGLMGTLAHEVMSRGGRVTGVITEELDEREVKYEGITELHTVGSMHERKYRMYDLADGFIALPGGFGTLDEFFEMLAWSVLEIHAKPCGLLNTKGYYDSLLGFVDHAVREGFITAPHRASVLTGDDPRDLLERMDRFSPPDMSAWWAGKAAEAQTRLGGDPRDPSD